MKFILTLSLFLPSFTFAQWDIPTPESHTHPGAETSPVSSPLTYPDEEGFQARAEVVIQGVSTSGLDKWRRGYFTGGDPGKYLPGHAMAKLLVNPEDPEPAVYFNDDRSYKEHYHFAAVNWARFLPIFGEEVLTEETQEKFAEAGFKYGRYKNPAGTDNHKTMWWTSANVLPYYLAGERGLSHQSRDATLAQAKQQLHQYIKGLFYAGQGEWDSNIYLMFTMNGLMNIYDFAEDPEARLLAKAGLDLLSASYAQKYTNGIFSGPHQRGFATSPYKSIADQSGFLWWGSADDLTAEDTRNFLYAMHAITSSWRPNSVITHIAKRENLPFPVEQQNSKANYWHGQGITPKPGASHESVYIDEFLTMGSLWDQHASQHSRFTIVTKDGSIFSGGHPRRSDHTGKKIALGYETGSGRFVQSAQAGPLYLALAKWPEDEEAAHSFFSYPENLTPKEQNAWWIFETSNNVIAVRPVSTTGEVEKASVEAKKKRQISMLQFPAEDQQSGFLVWVGDQSILDQLSTVEVTFDSGKSSVSVNVPNVHDLSLSFNPDPDGDQHGSRAADVEVDGRPVVLSDWKIFDGPLLQQTPGSITVSDGTDSFTINFTGDLPVYK